MIGRRNNFEASDGWVGCSTCERPVDARVLVADAKLRFLMEVQLALEAKGLTTPEVLGVIRDCAGVLEEVRDAAVENRPPVVLYGEPEPAEPERPAGKRKGRSQGVASRQPI